MLCAICYIVCCVVVCFDAVCCAMLCAVHAYIGAVCCAVRYDAVRSTCGVMWRAVMRRGACMVVVVETRGW